KRRFQARIDGYATASALSFFRQLLLREKGAYWTFIVPCASASARPSCVTPIPWARRRKAGPRLPG
ncbi:hypothetical protein, partial [Pseudomonas aeruginosa]|uniref:hypothetical protein n=1 Tax=Pseudomonas aeruginosa TaxID=287 RepID=UPI003BF57968